MALSAEKGITSDFMSKQNQLGLEQFERQKMFENPIFSALSRYLSPQGQGFMPDQLAGMRGQAIDNTNGYFNNAQQGLMTDLVRRGGAGGSMPVGGDFARSLGSLGAARASSLAGGLRDINIQNAQQALQNRFGAAQMFSGLAGSNANQMGGSMGRELGGLDARLQAGIMGKQLGFGNQFSSALAKGLGGGLASFATGSLSGLGGLGGMASGMGGPGAGFMQDVQSLPSQSFSQAGYGGGNMGGLLANPQLQGYPG